MDDVTLKPSLWRTCRVLANRRRLRLLQNLLQKPGQNVTQLAAHTHLPVPLTSRYLRELNARGILSVNRVSRWVSYCPRPNPSVPQARPLMAALLLTLRHRGDPSISQVFRLATAFTHPRRCAIVATLSRGPAGESELRRATGISLPAIRRHLQKLRHRGFISSSEKKHQLVTPQTPLAKALLQLAIQD